jgi:HD-like signal output (HDOD) protein
MAQSDAGITLERLVDRTSTIYSLPYFYERLNECINHPRSSIADIARIITEDQGLTARLLKLANSPLFGYYSRVDTIIKAVTIIGTQQLRDLALAASVMGVFTGIPEELMNMSTFWRHSVACGIIARTMAACLRENNVERYFVAGILHDVGQLVLCTAVPETAANLIRDSREQEELFFSTERRTLGFDHAELGGALMKAWKIPANIAEPVACHHAPQSAVQYPLESAVVHLSDIICQGLELGQSGEWCVPPLDQGAWERLNIPVSMIATVVKQAEPQLKETFAILVEGA